MLKSANLHKVKTILLIAISLLIFSFLSSNLVFGQEGSSKIILSPSFREIPVGREFQVDVIAVANSASVGADAYIDYDARVLEVVDIEAGEAFDVVPLKTAEDGRIKITALIEQGRKNFSGVGRIATLQMKTIDAGDTVLRVQYNSGDTTDSNIVSTKVTDTLGSVDEGIVLSGSAFERSLGAAKRFAFRAIPVFMFLIFAGVAAYVGYRYWKKKREEPKDVFIPREIPMDKPPESG